MFGLFQDSTSLPTILVLEDSDVNDEVKEEVRLSVEHFLQVKLTRKMYMCWQKNTWKSWWTSTSYCFLFQELVSDNLIGRTQPVFQFLCPLDKLLNEEEHYQGVWGILSSLAYFLTPGHEEEEVKIRRSAFLQVDILKPGSNFWLSFLSVIVRLKSCLTGEKNPVIQSGKLPG